MSFIQLALQKFDYYAKPEGQDPINKIMGLAKIGIGTGTFCALYDACLYSRCTNAAQFFNTAGYWLVPLTGICVTFSTVTYVATNIRKKDDKINYVLGAFAAGGVLHAWRPNPLISGWGTFFFLCYAILKKESKQNPKAFKAVFLPDQPPPKWYFPWRNVEYRNYHSKPRYEHQKNYYNNFY